jgi:regulator of replication initiation timing
MSREELKDKIQELEIRIRKQFSDQIGLVGVIKTMIEEEHFFPDAIEREIDSLESLINYDR